MLRLCVGKVYVGLLVWEVFLCVHVCANACVCVCVCVCLRCFCVRWSMLMCVCVRAREVFLRALVHARVCVCVRAQVHAFGSRLTLPM